MMMPGVRVLCVALQWDGMQALEKQAYVMQAQVMEQALGDASSDDGAYAVCTGDGTRA